MRPLNNETKMADDKKPDKCGAPNFRSVLRKTLERKPKKTKTFSRKFCFE